VRGATVGVVAPVRGNAGLRAIALAGMPTMLRIDLRGDLANCSTSRPMPSRAMIRCIAIGMINALKRNAMAAVM
jgi:hypothetical protein